MPRATILTFGCLLLCAGLLAAGLWPFNFRVQNTAGPAAGGGLLFAAPPANSKRELGGTVLTPAGLACRPQERCEPGAIAIAIRLEADGEARSCLRRIVELRRPDGGTAFFLSQWKSSLIVRAFNTVPGDGKPYREMGISGALAAGRTSLVTIVSGPQATDFYLDGRPARSYPGVGLMRAEATPEGHTLYLGNSPDLSCPWAGRVLEFVLYGKAPGGEAAAEGLERCEGGRSGAVAWFRFDRAVDETIEDLSGAGNDLWKPAHLVFHKRLLGLPDGQSFSRSDLAVNLAGFVPFGFLACLRFLAGGGPLRAGILAAAAAGLAVSLAIETTQAWLPGRDSSLLDLGANTLGAAAGALLCAGWRKRKIPPGLPLPKGGGPPF